MAWGTRNTSLTEKGYDVQEWQKYYHRHQQEYIRKRLRAIKMYYEGVGRQEISDRLGVTYKTLSGYLDLYLSAGLEGLVSPIVKPRTQRLSVTQKTRLKSIVLQESPKDYLKKEIFGL